MTPFLRNCQSVVPLLDAYHDGELAEDERNSVELHLRGCESCSRSLEQVGKLVVALKGLPTMAPSFDIADKFELLLEQKEAKKDAPVLSHSAPVQNVVGFKKFGWVAAAAASVVMTLFVGQYVLKHSGTPEIASVPTNVQAVGSGKSTQSTRDNQVSKTLQAEQIASSNSVESRGMESAKSTTEVANVPLKSAANDIASEHKTTSTIKPPVPKVEIASTATSSSGTATSVSAATDKHADSAAPRHSLVAFYEPETNSIPEELGISTDEDGLYAIKM